MKKILVPTDFSEASLKALKVAISIAKRKRNVSIRLAHVYKVPRIPSTTNADYGFDIKRQKVLVDEIHKKLNNLTKEDFFNDITIETQVVPHLSVLQLIQHKDNKDVDLIICGTHRKIEFIKSLDGTHVEVIIKNATCPVLCVNDKLEEPYSFDNLIFASDFTEEVHTQFPKLKKVLDALGGRLHLVKVVTPKHFENTLEVEKELKDFARKFYLTNFTVKVFNDDTVEKGIIDFASSKKTNLVAIETHGQSGVIHYIKNSITENLYHNSKLMVLTIKIPDGKSSSEKFDN